MLIQRLARSRSAALREADRSKPLFWSPVRVFCIFCRVRAPWNRRERGPSAALDAADQNIGALGARHAGPGSVARDPSALKLPGARTRSERCGGDKALTTAGSRLRLRTTGRRDCADRAAGGRAERRTSRLTATAERSRHRYLGSTESRRPAHGAAPVGVTGTRPGCCVTTTTPCVDGTAAGWAARSCTVTEVMLPWWCPPPLAVRTAPAPSALCRGSFTNPFPTSVQRRSRREDSRSK